MSRPRINLPDFVTAWENSQTSAEVAQKMNLKITGVLSKARELRKKGVPLKQMVVSRTTDITSALQTLANIRGVSVEELKPQ